MSVFLKDTVEIFVKHNLTFLDNSTKLGKIRARLRINDSAIPFKEHAQE